MKKWRPNVHALGYNAVTTLAAPLATFNAGTVASQTANLAMKTASEYSVSVPTLTAHVAPSKQPAARTYTVNTTVGSPASAGSAGTFNPAGHQSVEVPAVTHMVTDADRAAADELFEDLDGGLLDWPDLPPLDRGQKTQESTTPWAKIGLGVGMVLGVALLVRAIR